MPLSAPPHLPLPILLWGCKWVGFFADGRMKKVGSALKSPKQFSGEREVPGGSLTEWLLGDRFCRSLFCE
jgi:hypothetical protein